MDNKAGLARRKLLKYLTVAGGAVFSAQQMPEQWVRPVVDTVALPVHARMSFGPCEPIVIAGNTVTATHCACGCSSCPPVVYIPVTRAPGANVVTLGAEAFSNPSSGVMPCTYALQITFSSTMVEAAFININCAGLAYYANSCNTLTDPGAPLNIAMVDTNCANPDSANLQVQSNTGTTSNGEPTLEITFVVTIPPGP